MTVRWWIAACGGLVGALVALWWWLVGDGRR